MYVSPTRALNRRRREPVIPSGVPRSTASPRLTSIRARYDTVVRTPSACCSVTYSWPATAPANVTTPSAHACTTLPGEVPYSIPRCPGPYGLDGGTNGSVTGASTGGSYATVPAAPATLSSRATSAAADAANSGATKATAAPPIPMSNTNAIALPTGS
jgi:hypothetical protein